MTQPNPAGDWLFRGLLVIAGALLLYSWFLPWWSLDIAMIGRDQVIVHPWGEDANLGTWELIFDMPTMPAFFEPFAWAYLAFCVLLVLAALVIKGGTFRLGRFSMPRPRALTALAGLAYVVVPAIAALAIMYNLGKFEVKGVTVPLQGTVLLDFGAPWASDVTSSLRAGYWWAWAASIFLLLLALLHPVLTGRRGGQT